MPNKRKTTNEDCFRFWDLHNTLRLSYSGVWWCYHVACSYSHSQSSVQLLLSRSFSLARSLSVHISILHTNAIDTDLCISKYPRAAASTYFVQYIAARYDLFSHHILWKHTKLISACVTVISCCLWIVYAYFTLWTCSRQVIYLFIYFVKPYTQYKCGSQRDLYLLSNQPTHTHTHARDKMNNMHIFGKSLPKSGAHTWNHWQTETSILPVHWWSTGCCFNQITSPNSMTIAYRSADECTIWR